VVIVACAHFHVESAPDRTAQRICPHDAATGEVEGGQQPAAVRVSGRVSSHSGRWSPCLRSFDVNSDLWPVLPTERYVELRVRRRTFGRDT